MKTSLRLISSSSTVPGLGHLQGQADAALAPVGPLEDRGEAAPLHDRVHPEDGGQAALPVAPLGVLDLDHLGSPVRQDRARRGHEGELGHLEHAHALHRLQHQLSFLLSSRVR